VFILKDIISGHFNYVEQNGYLKIELDEFGGLVTQGEGLVALQSLSSIKKSTSPFNFQLNEHFSKFLQQQMTISKFRSDAFQENMRCGGSIHPLITLNLTKGIITEN